VIDLSRQLDETIKLLDAAISPDIIAGLRARKAHLEHLIFDTKPAPAERPDSETWERLRVAALRRDNYTCQGCGATCTKLNVHHIVDVQDGGKSTLANLITLCDGCHGRIHPWLEVNHESSATPATMGVPRR
jgi:5-methylcytosine-specific restriction endonuclease McrA